MRVPIAHPVTGPAQASTGRRHWLGRAFVGLLLLFVGGAIGLFASTLGGKKPHEVRRAVRSVQAWLDPGAQASLPQLVLDIKFRHVQTLRERRDAWAERGARIAGDNEATPASVRVGQRMVEVGVTLAGKPDDQGPGELGRLRLAVKSEGELWGMRRLTLDDPERPGFVQEALFYGALQRAGLLAPHLQSVRLDLNGKDVGVAVAVEQPSVEGLQRAGRPDAAMIGWDPSLTPGGNADAAAWLDPRTLEPQVEGGAKRLLGTPLADQAALGVTLLRDLVRGTATAEETVDIARTARFVAICEVWGQGRALQWNASRWVLHPLTLRLEPYVRLPAGGDGRLADGLILLQKLMESKVFRAAYEVALHEEAMRVTGPDQATLQKRLAPQVPVLARADTMGDLAEIKGRAQQVLDAAKLKLTPDKIVTPVMHPLAAPRAADLALPFATVDSKAMRIDVPAGTWQVPVTVQLPIGYTLSLAAGTRLQFGAGAWLVVRGPTLFAGTAAAPVVLNGRTAPPVAAVDLAGQPTAAAVAAGKPEVWGGIAVLAAVSSRWSHVQVHDAGAVGLGVWQPQAAVVWSDGQIDLDDCRFDGLGGALAAVRLVGGSVRMQRVTIVGGASAGAAAAGLHLTHVHGDLNDLRIESPRGDAIDVVGGTVGVRALKVRDAGGAAVWAAQAAQVEAIEVDAERVGSGFVARDGARVRASASRIASARHLGYLAYNQVPGALAARIDTMNVTVQGARQNHLCTGGGAVALEGRQQDCTAVSVQQLVAAGITHP